LKTSPKVVLRTSSIRADGSVYERTVTVIDHLNQF